MSLYKKLQIWFRRKTRNVKLVDQYVIIIMVVLLLQSLLTLLLSREPDLLGVRIDTVLRTTMASIFGYIVSSNFIGGRGDSESAEYENKNNVPQTRQQIRQSEVQIRLVGRICVFSVFVLLIIRYCLQSGDMMTAYVSLYRDFVSGCVGFLIGMPAEEKN